MILVLIWLGVCIGAFTSMAILPVIENNPLDDVVVAIIVATSVIGVCLFGTYAM